MEAVYHAFAWESVMNKEEVCKCGRFLYFEEEKECGKCDQCIDDIIERDRDRREWDHYHQN